MKNKFFAELVRCLREQDIEVGTVKKNALPILLQNQEVIFVFDNSNVYLNIACEANNQECDHLYNKVNKLAKSVFEYIQAMDTAPQFTAVTEDNYRLLADFNGVVLAGAIAEGTGYIFTTWKWDANHEHVYDGAYFINNYEDAKKSFVIRSGLITDYLFTKDELIELYNCCQSILDIPIISEKHACQLFAVSNKIQSVIPTPLGPSEISKQNTTLKLYMPLYANLFYRDEWNIPNNYAETVYNTDLSKYEQLIQNKIIDEQLLGGMTERGLMHYYSSDDTVNAKVQSMFFVVETRDDQLWGVALCKVLNTLTTDELESLKEYIAGQASDGFGEGFEQRPIAISEDKELFVHLYSMYNWDIQTEEELFPSIEIFNLTLT